MPRRAPASLSRPFKGRQFKLGLRHRHFSRWFRIQPGEPLLIFSAETPKFFGSRLTRFRQQAETADHIRSRIDRTAFTVGPSNLQACPQRFFKLHFNGAGGSRSYINVTYSAFQ
jgi:hypothetical protein